jgi:hypothetical protein
MKQKMKGTMMIFACICVVLLLTPACTAGLSTHSVTKNNTNSQSTSQSQYWGLLFAVGEYQDAPDMNRPEMLEACNNLFSTLLDSPAYWQPSNIRVKTASQATLQNLIKDLLWLWKNSKSEDYVLVYITTHGGQLKNANGLPWDLPPKDETDGSDEVLAMYNGFSQWYGVIYDDLLNFFLGLIKCKGLCLIVDSCYSGGFNDPPKNVLEKTKFTAESFVNGFVEDLAAPGRIVLMSCEEDEVSYGADFSNLLIGGFQGSADFWGNGDGINSAEESFEWAEFWLDLIGQQHPTILDWYSGEFPVTHT